MNSIIFEGPSAGPPHAGPIPLGDRVPYPAGEGQS